MIREFTHWVHDYLYAARHSAYAFWYRTPPSHYLGFIKEGRVPVILIPGVYERWQFLKKLGDFISYLGHPLYVLPHLGANARTIDHSAHIVRELIQERDLENVVIIGHSKGGLIGKELLAFHNKDGRIKKVIAIASPFSGSYAAHALPLRALRELAPSSLAIRKLHDAQHVNRHIISIFGTFDNHVWPTRNCALEGAKNMQVNVHGHHKILSHKSVHEIIVKELDSI